MQHLILFSEIKKRAAAINRTPAALAKAAGMASSTTWSWGRGDHEPRGSKLDLVNKQLTQEEVTILQSLLERFGCSDLFTHIEARSVEAAGAAASPKTEAKSNSVAEVAA